MENTAPWYDSILLPNDFGRLPLQSYCSFTYGPIHMIHITNKNRGMEPLNIPYGMYEVGNSSWKDRLIGKFYVGKFFPSSCSYMEDRLVGNFFPA